MVRVGSLAGN